MLTAIRHVGSTPRKQALWLFRCECGNEKEIWGSSVVHGYTKSCGCFQKENPARLEHGMAGTPTFVTWAAMRARCFNPNNPSYPRYGGRGVSICPEWDSFEQFYKDMGQRPGGMSLDRWPNKDGNYEPGNCRWATPTQQNRNRSSTTMVDYMGECLPLQEWAERFGIKYPTLWHRYKIGERGEVLFRKTRAHR